VDEWEGKPGAGDNYLLDVVVMAAVAAPGPCCPTPGREQLRKKERAASYAALQAAARARAGAEAAFLP
jgi:hypothetical protein